MIGATYKKPNTKRLYKKSNHKNVHTKKSTGKYALIFLFFEKIIYRVEGSNPEVRKKDI